MQPNWRELYDYGFSVFALPHGSKVPNAPWSKYQTERCTEAELTQWSQQKANAAIATGQVSGVIVLDIDSEAGEQAVENLVAPVTPTACTAKGRHLYFKWPGFSVRNFARKLDGCDLRGDGGYVLAPGSLHPSGVHYEWLITPSQAPFADTPQWLLDMAKKPEPVQLTTIASLPRCDADDAYVQAAVDGELATLASTSEGGRNDQLNLSAFALGQFVGGGYLSAEAVRTMLYHAAMQIGLTHVETVKSIRSGLTAGQLQPRAVPERAIDITQCSIIVPDHGGITAVPGHSFKVPAECTREAAQSDQQPEAPIDGLSGLLAELVEWLELTAKKPQPVLAVGASLCALGALIGRNYRTDFRANMYIIGVAPSGAGKNHAPEQLTKLFALAGLDRHVGPERIASASGLLDHVRMCPSMVMFMDEFGHSLAQMTDPRASQHTKEILVQMTRLYTGSDGVHKGTGYSMSGKLGEPPLPINEPNLNIYGMCTPDQFWSAMTSKEVIDGSVARMLVLHGADNPPRNKNRVLCYDTSKLQQKLNVIANAGDYQRKGNLSNATGTITTACEPKLVPVSVDAQGELDDYYDGLIDQANGNRFAPLLHRRAEQVNKVALVLAVSDNAYEPKVTLQHARWAIRLIDHCSEQLIGQIKHSVADNQTEANHKRALAVVRDSGPTGISASDFCKRTQFLTRRERSDILQSLEDSGQIVRTVLKKNPSAPGPATTSFVVNAN